MENMMSEKSVVPTDPEFFKGIGKCIACSVSKKCCKKYKKGKRCKDCPGKKK